MGAYIKVLRSMWTLSGGMPLKQFERGGAVDWICKVCQLIQNYYYVIFPYVETILHFNRSHYRPIQITSGGPCYWHP